MRLTLYLDPTYLVILHPAAQSIKTPNPNHDFLIPLQEPPVGTVYLHPPGLIQRESPLRFALKMRFKVSVILVAGFLIGVIVDLSSFFS